MRIGAGQSPKAGPHFLTLRGPQNLFALCMGNPIFYILTCLSDGVNASFLSMIFPFPGVLCRGLHRALEIDNAHDVST